MKKNKKIKYLQIFSIFTAFSINATYATSSDSRIVVDDENGSDITGYFYGLTGEDDGGAIYVPTHPNSSSKSYEVGDIFANFEENAISSSYFTYGGAICNFGTIGNITGSFTKNSATSTGSSAARGGAIYNGSTIGDIDGDFIENYVYSSVASGSAGGAIYNLGGTIGNITGDFTANYASSVTSTYGGAIYNSGGEIGNIKGDFSKNHATYGGAISNYGEIGNLTGDFTGNYAADSGGVIYNSGGEIGDITGDFTGNHAATSGGTIYNKSGTIGNITGDFIGNYVSSTDSSSEGGAIYNFGTIGNIVGDFIGNSATYSSTSTVSYSSSGGAIYNEGTIGDITGNFIGNNASTYGGAIYNYSNGTITFTANSTSMEFTGNTANGLTNAIYNVGTIYFNAFDGYSIVVNDGISGTDYPSNQLLEINNADLSDYSASTYGTVEFNNTVANQTVTVYNGTLVLGAFEGATYEDFYGDDEDLVVVASSASLINANLTVNAGAYLNVETSFEMYSSTLTNNGTMNVYGRVGGDISLGVDSTLNVILTSSNIGTNGILSSIIGSGDYTIYVSFGDDLTVDLLSDTSIYYSYTDFDSLTIDWGDYKTGDIYLDDYSITISEDGNTISFTYIDNSSDSESTVEIPSDTTLTYLYNEGLSIIKSAYTLEEVSSEGTFTITKYLVDADTNALTAILYDVKINEVPTNDYVDISYSWAIDDTTKNRTLNLSVDYESLTTSSQGEDSLYLNNTSKEGGAIYNNSTISDKITSDFIANKAYDSTSYDISGGAIYNYAYASIADISGSFIANYASTALSSSEASGGAIYNAKNATIGSIAGSFIANYTYSENSYALGGAIYNHSDASIKSITGDFIFNYASGSNASGGAIYNTGSIGNIVGSFVGNYASASSALGGAIYNYYDEIGNITGDFIANYALSTSDTGSASGGAILNDDAEMGNITGDFIANYAYGYGNICGGAIYNETSTIGSITGDFIGNYTAGSSASSVNSAGGAIYNYLGGIGEIKGDFIGNYVSSTGSASTSKGGAIYNASAVLSNSSSIESLEGDFIGNYVSSACYSEGGAIWNGSSIGDIYVDFIGNYAYAESTSSFVSSEGGAIYNYSILGDITGDFTGNYASADSSWSSASGGAIYNWIYTIGDISGDFIANYAISSASDSGYIASAYGGAIYNVGTMGDISGDFIANYASATCYSNGAVWGGAIYNDGTIGDITGDFIGNYTSASNDNATTYGGAIYNAGKISILASTDDLEFTGNYTEKPSSTTSNAIYNDSAFNATVSFKAFDGYSIVVNDGIDGTEDYMSSQLLEINNVSILSSDKVEGYVTENYIDGSMFTEDDLGKVFDSNYDAYDYIADSYGTVEFNNEVANQTVTVYNGTLLLGEFDGATYEDFYGDGEDLVVEASKASLSNVNLTVNSGAYLNIETALEMSNTTLTNNGTMNVYGTVSGNISLGADSTLNVILTSSNIGTDGILSSISGSGDYTISVSFGDDLSTTLLSDTATTIYTAAEGFDSLTLDWSDVYASEYYSDETVTIDGNTITFGTIEDLVVDDDTESDTEKDDTESEEEDDDTDESYADDDTESDTEKDDTDESYADDDTESDTEKDDTDESYADTETDTDSSGTESGTTSDATEYVADSTTSNDSTTTLTDADSISVEEETTFTADTAFTLDTSDEATVEISGEVAFEDAEVSEGSEDAEEPSKEKTAYELNTDTTLSGEIAATYTTDDEDATLTTIKTNTGKLSLVDETVVSAIIKDSQGNESYGVAITNAGDSKSLTISANGTITVRGAIIGRSDVTIDAGTTVVEEGSYVSTSYTADKDTDHGTTLYVEGTLVLAVDDNGNMGYIADTGLVTGSGSIEVDLDVSVASLEGASYMIVDEITLANNEGEKDSILGEISYDDTNLSLENGVIVVSNLTDFQEANVDGDANTLALAKGLDSIKATDDADTNALRSEFKSAMINQDLDSYIVGVNSYIAEVNTMLLNNQNVANVNRARSILSKSAGVEMPEDEEGSYSIENEDGTVSVVDAGEVAAIKYTKVAQLQSINLLGSKSASNDVAGYDYWSVGATANFDEILSDKALVGASIGGTYNKVEGDAGDKANSTTFLLNAYAAYANEGLELFANVGYAHFWNKGSTNTGASADWDSDAVNALVGISFLRETSVEGLTISPIAMFNLVYLHADSAKYSNGVTVEDTSYLSAKLMFGLEAQYALTTQFNATIRAMYAYELGDDSYNNTYGFAGILSGVEYVGTETGRSSALMGLGLSYDFSETCSMYFDYNAYIYSSLITHSLNLSVGIKF